MSKAQAFAKAFVKISEGSLADDFKGALPAAGLMVPIVFGKNYLEQGLKVGIQDRLAGGLDRSTAALKTPDMGSLRRRYHTSVMNKLQAPRGAESVIHTPKGNRLNRRFAESMGRGLGAASIGFGAGLLQMVLISKLLNRVSGSS